MFKMNTPAENSNGLKWNDFKQFKHKYLVNVPKSAEDVRAHSDLITYFQPPYPIVKPTVIKDLDSFRNLFKCKPKFDSHMDYYRKLYMKEKILKKSIKCNTVAEVPQYIINIMQDAEEENTCDAWNYTGGVLDTFCLNGKDYIVNSGLNCETHIIDMSNCRIIRNVDIEDTVPIYSIKAAASQNQVLVAMRHKNTTSVIKIADDIEISEQISLCRSTTSDEYRDMCFNPIQNIEYATITDTYKLKILDIENCTVVTKYRFDTPNDTCGDSLVQIEFLDANTLCFMNRCCMYLLDLRSLEYSKLCLKDSWLECDDLCCITKNRKSTNFFYVTSKHKLHQVDVRSLKSINHVMHMLSSTPFMTSVKEDGLDDYLSIFGIQTNDRVIIHDNGTPNIPMYVPSIMDTLTKVSLTYNINFTDDLEQRLSLPVVGMKLHRDARTKEMILFFSTIAGDVFKQKILSSPLDDATAEQALVDWIQSIPENPPKTVEATSIRNLNKIMHTITNNLPKEKNLKRLMGTNASLKFRKRYGDISRYIHNDVGEAINAIWDTPVVTQDSVAPTASSDKVTDWLSATEHSIP